MKNKTPKVVKTSDVATAIEWVRTSSRNHGDLEEFAWHMVKTYPTIVAGYQTRRRAKKIDDLENMVSGKVPISPVNAHQQDADFGILGLDKSTIAAVEGIVLQLARESRRKKERFGKVACIKRIREYGRANSINALTGLKEAKDVCEYIMSLHAITTSF